MPDERRSYLEDHNAQEWPGDRDCAQCEGRGMLNVTGDIPEGCKFVAHHPFDEGVTVVTCRCFRETPATKASPLFHQHAELGRKKSM